MYTYTLCVNRVDNIHNIHSMFHTLMFGVNNDNVGVKKSVEQSQCVENSTSIN